MANVVKLKRSAVSGNVPSTSQLELGEVALNTFDGELFFKKDNGSESIVSVVTEDGTQTLSNKTISDDLTITGSLILETDAEALDLSSGAAILDDQGADGTSGQVLSSTGNGVRWITAASGGGAVIAIRQSYTATSGQTTFTVTGGYDVGFADVYLNGAKLVNGVDVNVTSGTNFVLAAGATAGDSVDFVAYDAFAVANTYTQAQIDAGFVTKSNNLSDLNSASTALTNLGIANHDDITVDGSGNVSVTGNINVSGTSTVTPSIILTTTEDSSSAAPIIELKRNSASPSNGDYLGQLKFVGENDADQEVIYAKITGKTSDVTDGTEDGLIEFAVKENGSNTIVARITKDSFNLINSTDLEVDGTVTATSYAGDGSSLTGISAGATGGGTDQIFYENGQNVTTNYTITTNKNAMTAGPITVNSGVTVTVPSGSTWTIV